MTTTSDERIYARYQQVLAWRNAGATYPEIGRRLGVSPQRASELGRQARRWQQRALWSPLPLSTPPDYTAQTPVHVVPITPQAKGALRRTGVWTMGQVAALSDAALLRLPYIGAGTVATLRACLAAHDHSAA